MGGQKTCGSRRTLLKGAGSVAAALTAGCVESLPGAGSSTQKVHVLTEEGGDDYRTFWMDMKSQFEEEYDATVKMEVGGLGTSVVERAAKLVQSGSPPEIVLPGKLGIAALWARKGYLATVDDVMDTLVSRYGEPPAAFRMRIDGSDHIIPGWSGFSQLWYRRDVLSDVGLSKSFRPNTWEKMLKYAEAADGSDRRGVLVPANSTGDSTMAHLTHWLRTNGGQYTEYDGKQWRVAFDEGTARTRMVETLEFLRKLHQYSSSGSGATYSTLVHSIHNGAVSSNVYPGTRPKTQAIANDASFARDVDNVVGPERRTVTTRGQNAPILLFADANVEMAKKFVELFTREENFARAHWVSTPVHNSPVYPGLLESDVYQQRLRNDLSSAWTDDQLDRYLVQQRNAVVVNPGETKPPNPYFGAITNSRLVSELVADVLGNDRDVDAAVDEYAGKIDDTLLKQQDG